MNEGPRYHQMFTALLRAFIASPVSFALAATDITISDTESGYVRELAAEYLNDYRLTIMSSDRGLGIKTLLDRMLHLSQASEVTLSKKSLVVIESG